MELASQCFNKIRYAHSYVRYPAYIHQVCSFLYSESSYFHKVLRTYSNTITFKHIAVIAIAIIIHVIYKKITLYRWH